MEQKKEVRETLMQLKKKEVSEEMSIGSLFVKMDYSKMLTIG